MWHGLHPQSLPAGCAHTKDVNMFDRTRKDALDKTSTVRDVSILSSVTFNVSMIQSVSPVFRPVVRVNLSPQCPWLLR